jgi:hypothetical protein
MIKNFLLIGILLLFLACSGEKKSTDNTEPQEKEYWLVLENKDSIQFLGFTERGGNASARPVVFAHYKSKRFNGGEEAVGEEFKQETLLIAKQLKEIVAKIPDTLVLQAMGESEGTFMKRQNNWNTAVYFDGQEWRLLEKK